MKKLWEMIKRAVKALFSKDTVAKVWQILFSGAKSTASGILTNEAVMNAAYDYAKSMLTSDASSDSKRTTFDQLMRDYLTSQGIVIGTSLLNTVREIAVSAVKAEAESASCNLD